MGFLSEVLGNLGIGQQQALMFALLLPFFPLLLIVNRRIRERGRPPLRSIPGYAELQEYLGEATESGRSAHVSMGTGGIGTGATAESLAGLNVLEHVAGQAAATGLDLVATVSDPSLWPVAQDVVREAYVAQGYPESYDPGCVRFISSDKVAYAAGVMDILGHEDVSCNVMVGSFGDEFLLMSEVGARNGLRQVGGTTSPQILPFVYASMGQTLIGEEIFAAGAYLLGKTSHLASLAVQDWLRTAIILTILIGILARSLA
ncbi:MAG: hypothetical protein MUP64_03440 [Anaerolineae bacterium]|nr:hypothetical protein [Anaerolineae bacterium]